MVVILNTCRNFPYSYLICIAVILFLARMLPGASATPNDSPAGGATEPVPLSDTAGTAHTIDLLLYASINNSKSYT